MDYRKNPEDVVDFLEELEEGDRVYIEADRAKPKDDVDNVIFKRGDELLIDDHGTVIETGEHGVSVELDEKWIRSAHDPEKWATNVFRLGGESIIAEWKYVGEKESRPDKRPADLQVAMLNRIEQKED